MRGDHDFGDGWQHDVVVATIELARSDVTYPVCLTGKRACPPEDCGGPWGYGNLLAAFSDPTHEEHEELTEWAGQKSNPYQRFLASMNALASSRYAISRPQGCGRGRRTWPAS